MTTIASPKTAKGVYVTTDELLRLRFVTKDLQLITRKKSSALNEGDVKTHFRGRGMEFAEVRPYQPGDDVRSIDWRVTARSTQPYTKLFQEERERPVLIVVDQRSPMFFGSQRVFKSYAAAQMAAAIGWIAMHNNDRIGALIFGNESHQELRARRGKHALLALVNRLQEYNQALTSPIFNSKEKSISLDEILTDLRRIAKPGTAVFILSDFHDVKKSTEESLYSLARHTDVSLIKFSDPLEQALPQDLQLTVSNTKDRLTLNTGSKTLRHDYKDNFEQAHSRLIQQCINTGAKLLSLDTSTDINSAVIDIFSARNRSRRKAK